MHEQWPRKPSMILFCLCLSINLVLLLTHSKYPMYTGLFCAIQQATLISHLWTLYLYYLLCLKCSSPHFHLTRCFFFFFLTFTSQFKYQLLKHCILMKSSKWYLTGSPSYVPIALTLTWIYLMMIVFWNISAYIPFINNIYTSLTFPPTFFLVQSLNSGENSSGKPYILIKSVWLQSLV